MIVPHAVLPTALLAVLLSLLLIDHCFPGVNLESDKF